MTTRVIETFHNRRITTINGHGIFDRHRYLDEPASYWSGSANILALCREENITLEQALKAMKLLPDAG
jgi:hypothetical protein